MDEVEAIQKNSSQAIQPQLWKSLNLRQDLRKNNYLRKSIFIHEILIMLKRILIGIGLLFFIILKYCDFKKNEDQDITYNTNLIQQAYS
jgi:hypothetical protein